MTVPVGKETPARKAIKIAMFYKVFFDTQQGLELFVILEGMSHFPIPIKSYSEEEFKISSVVQCQKEFLFHSSGKKLESLNPQHNRVLGAYGVHEYGIPVIYASDKPSNAFCYESTELYQQTKEKYGTSVYHRLINGNHKILLGAKLKGYIYVLSGKDFYEVTREDFEIGKWIKSTEWITDKEVKPVDVIEIIEPYDWEMIPEYEFLGDEYVGELSAEEYLAFAQDDKVKEAIREVIEKDFTPVVPVGLKRYLQ